MSEEKSNKKLWERNWFIVLISIVFAPAGIFMIWKYADWKKSLKVIMTIISAFIFLWILGTIGGGNNQDNQASSQKGTLSYMVVSDEEINKDEDFKVTITGKTNDGEEVNKDYSGKINKNNNTKYGAGVYKFSVDVSQLNKDDKIYKVNSQEINFDGNKDIQVKLKIELDNEAIAKKKAEADAKAKAEAEAKAQQQAQQAQKQTEPTKTYYLVTSTNTFHAFESCSAYQRSKPGNRSTVTGTVSGLEAQGYHACKKCF